MAYSSILGGERAPVEPSGRESELLGPSNNSDSGSDTVGTSEDTDESVDAGRTGDRGAVAGRDAPIGADILPNEVIDLADGEGFPEADPDGSELTDLDNGTAQKLADADEARAPSDPDDAERDA